MGIFSKFKLCKGSATDTLSAIGDAKELFCVKGKSAVEADPEKATKTLKAAAKALKKSGNPQAQSLAEMCEKPVEKFDDIKDLLDKVPGI